MQSLLRKLSHKLRLPKLATPDRFSTNSELTIQGFERYAEWEFPVTGQHTTEKKKNTDRGSNHSHAYIRIYHHIAQAVEDHTHLRSITNITFFSIKNGTNIHGTL